MGNDGTINGATWVGSGQVGGESLSFDGTDDYVNLNTNLSSLHSDPPSWTISCWLKWSSTGEERYCGQGDSSSKPSLRLSVNYAGGSDSSSDGDVGVRYRDSNGNYLIWGSSGLSLNDGNWHHIAFVCRDVTTADVKCFVDGTDETGVGLDEGPSTSSLQISANMYVGAENNNGSDQTYFTGDIDDYRAYPITLSQPEIEALANRTETSPVPTESTL